MSARTFVFTLLVLIAATARSAPALQEPSALESSLRRARVGGTYRMLLRQIRIDDDRARFSDFHELGYRTETAAGGFTDLPRGYWVYVAPYWYIWRDKIDPTAPARDPVRPWGSERATGRPDTPEAGDLQTAWASSTKDDSAEWLMLEYDHPIVVRSASIYETFNPGAVVRVTAFGLDGGEIEVFKRARPWIPPAPSRIFRVDFSRQVRTNRIKIYLDSPAVPGWNEIDAVSLREVDGGLHWAVAAEASSIYGVSPGGGKTPSLDQLLQLP